MIEYDQERKPKKKKKQAQSSYTWLVVGIVTGIFLLVGVVVLVIVLNSPAGDKGVQAQGNGAPLQAPVQPQPPLPIERGLPKEGPPKGLVQSVRAAAYRPERLNELRQIGLFMNQLVDQNNGRVPRTKQEFIDFIKRDAASLAQAVEEDYYVLNLKVNMRLASAVIAYECLQDQGGYQSVRVDASVEPIRFDELKKLVPDLKVKN